MHIQALIPTQPFSPCQDIKQFRAVVEEGTRCVTLVMNLDSARCVVQMHLIRSLEPIHFARSGDVRFTVRPSESSLPTNEAQSAYTYLKSRCASLSPDRKSTRLNSSH